MNYNEEDHSNLTAGIIIDPIVADDLNNNKSGTMMANDWIFHGKLCCPYQSSEERRPTCLEFSAALQCYYIHA
jgi:hypothetical protein